MVTYMSNWKCPCWSFILVFILSLIQQITTITLCMVLVLLYSAGGFKILRRHFLFKERVANFLFIKVDWSDAIKTFSACTAYSRQTAAYSTSGLSTSSIDKSICNVFHMNSRLSKCEHANRSENANVNKDHRTINNKPSSAFNGLTAENTDKLMCRQAGKRTQKCHQNRNQPKT